MTFPTPTTAPTSASCYQEGCHFPPGFFPGTPDHPYLPANPADPGTPPSTHAPADPSTGSLSGLPFTGADIVELAIVGLALLTAGWLLARRRAH